MYESGVSPLARLLLVGLVILLGVVLILAGSGCSCKCAHAEELKIVTQTGLKHHFF